VGLQHGLGRTKVGAWMPRTVVVVLAHQGVGHLTDVLLTLHNLMGDAGIYVKQNKNENCNYYQTPSLCQSDGESGRETSVGIADFSVRISGDG